MEIVYIGFTRPKSWFNPFSWLIRLVECTSYSHVYIRFSIEDKNVVFQASGLLVNFIQWENFLKKESLIKEFKLEILDESRKKLIDYAFNELGTPYSIKEILGLVIVLIYRLFNKKITNPFADQEKSFFCSELAECVIANFVDSSINLDPDTALPKDIYEYLDKYESI